MLRRGFLGSALVATHLGGDVAAAAPEESDPDLRTQSLVLRNLPASEALKALIGPGLPSPDNANADQGLLGKNQELVAWTVDPSQNAVVLIGSPRALEQSRELIMLLDHAPARMLIEVRVFELEDRDQKGLQLEREAQTTGESAVLSSAQLGQVMKQGRAVALAVKLPAVNNNRFTFRWALRERTPAGQVSGVVRTNGDGSLTLTAEGVLSPGVQAVDSARQLGIARRVPVGGPLLVRLGRHSFLLVKPNSAETPT